jgi:uncharacterized integral membrane protein
VTYRILLTIGAVVLFIAAATEINAPPIVWQPTWPVRLGFAVVGFLLAMGAMAAARAAQTAAPQKPDA